MNLKIRLPKPYDKQQEFLDSNAKRKVLRAGRRSGKTTLMAILAVSAFLNGKRILYAAPTDDQIDRFWTEVKRALSEPIEHNIFYKNETKHIIELSGKEQRIRAKTAWNSDTLRGDYADILILDEYQDMDESAWNDVGAPMLLDNNGDCIFCYTQKYGKKHIKKIEKRTKNDSSGRWKFFTFTSFDNPHISKEALDEITEDMTKNSFDMEIMALDIDDVPGALWKKAWIDNNRVGPQFDLLRIAVGVDPSAGGNDECGIVVCGMKKLRNESGKIKPHLYVLGDYSLHGSSSRWAKKVIEAYNEHEADFIVAEKNNGGDMVEDTIRTADGGQNLPIKLVHATRGKATRADPISVLYENNRGHHIGVFEQLESQMTTWIPGNNSPDRLDALVWAATHLTGTTANRGARRT